MSYFILKSNKTKYNAYNLGCPDHLFSTSPLQIILPIQSLNFFFFTLHNTSYIAHRAYTYLASHYFDCCHLILPTSTVKACYH